MCHSIGICLALATCAMPRAEQVRAEVRRLGGASLWPGFAPASTPLAIYDGERSWIFSGDAARSVPGRLPEITANSRALIEGVPTATLLLPPDLSAREAAALAAHEAFHVFQRARHPKWPASEADLFPSPGEEDIALDDRRR